MYLLAYVIEILHKAKHNSQTVGAATSIIKSIHGGFPLNAFYNAGWLT